MQLVNLDEARPFMPQEIDGDIASGKLYLSPRLTSKGEADYPDLLKQAAKSHDDSWLAAQLRSAGRLNTEETRSKPTGGMTVAKVPSNAAEMLAEGEFNRFYLRGLCLYAIEKGIQTLAIYRAKQVSRPRPESEARIGAHVSPQTLLADLRTHPGVETALKVPGGPNSGLSARLP